MDDKEILAGLNKSDNKKKIIFFTGIGILAVAIVVFVMVLTLGNPSDSKKKDSTAYNTELTEDGSADPENMEDDSTRGNVVEAYSLPSRDEWSNGIDVSKWQGKIDWNAVKADGIEFAFVRIGYRGENGTIYKDANADYNIQQARKAGVLVGIYFFSTATSEAEATEEANWTLKAIEGYPISYPVVYDCEGYNASGSRMNAMSVEQRTDCALAYLKTISKAGYDTMFYGSLQAIENSVDWDMERIEENHKVWVAHYTYETYPKVESPDYDSKMHAWQYTNSGNVNGIDGNVDMVVCYFKNAKADAKNPNSTPDDAKEPLTEEERLYQKVGENVTAKEVTNLRKEATTRSDVVVALQNGEVVTRVGIGTNGWSKLIYNGQTVYAISSYLTTDLTVTKPEKPEQDVVDNQVFTPQNDQVTAKEEVNLRAMPNTDSQIVGKLVSGTFLTRTAVGNQGWSRLNYNGQTVYAVTSYLSHEVVSQPSTPTVPSDGFAQVNEQVTAKEETNLRTAPTTSDSEVVYLLKNGEYVTRIGIHSNGWSKLLYNGQTVYAISSYLTQ